jgi:hypothetical protein
MVELVQIVSLAKREEMFGTPRSLHREGNLVLAVTTSRIAQLGQGGTSLSKGWGLIQRFSEDIDIFLDPTAFEPPLGEKGIDRELKKLRQAIEQHPALTFVEKESQTIGGLGRNDRFEYAQRFA